MHDLAAERVHHAYGIVEHGLYHRLIHAAALDQFANQYALIDQVNRKVACDKAAIFVLDLTWVGNDTIDPLRFEIVCEQDKFTIAWHFAPVENGDARLFMPTTPLLVGVYQDMHDAMARGKCAYFVF